MEIISLNQSKALGLKRYFTDQICPNGHISERHVSTRACVDCVKMKLKKYRNENPDKINTSHKQWRKTNPDKVRASAKRWYASNSEKDKAWSRAWVVANPERHAETCRKWKAANRDRVNELGRNWYAANIERLRKKANMNALKHRRIKGIMERPPALSIEEKRARKRIWRVENPIKVAKIRESWRKRNLERMAAHYRNYLAKKKGNGGSHTVGDIAEILASQNGKCAYCCVAITKYNKHVDHIEPISRGGSNNPNNLQITCRTCNLRKGAKDPMKFLLEVHTQ